MWHELEHEDWNGTWAWPSDKLLCFRGTRDKLASIKQCVIVYWIGITDYYKEYDIDTNFF
jgi:hypothetical protein